MMTASDAQHPLLRVLNQGAQPETQPVIRILPAEDRLAQVTPDAVLSFQLVGQRLLAKVSQFWQRTSVWTKTQMAARQKRKRLKVCESVSLGEKRFVAVIQVDGQQFLVGGAANSIAMLAQLEKQGKFSDLLRESRAQEQPQ